MGKYCVPQRERSQSTKNIFTIFRLSASQQILPYTPMIPPHFVEFLSDGANEGGGEGVGGQEGGGYEIDPKAKTELRERPRISSRPGFKRCLKTTGISLPPSFYIYIFGNLTSSSSTSVLKYSNQSHEMKLVHNDSFAVNIVAYFINDSFRMTFEFLSRNKLYLSSHQGNSLIYKVIRLRQYLASSQKSTSS